MRYSKMFIPTQKETPADAQVMSHQLMVRAGMIGKVASGIYNYLPLGQRVIQKISQIIREEMNRIHSQEISMPMVQPKELWESSGRWFEYGPELLRLQDRKKGQFCLGPTHEEVVTQLVKDHVKSYKQLPWILYQIQTKFRDEVRPRFGLMRGREFLMKDAYSFSVSKEDALRIYDDMVGAYHRIFERCGLRFKAVEADTGSIGGNRSHEFQVLADTGEDAIAVCKACGYAANIELASIGKAHTTPIKSTEKNYEKIYTPNQKTIDEVADYLAIPTTQTIKALMYIADSNPVMALCRGDHTINEPKLKKALSATHIRMMDDEEIAQFGPKGFLGPIGLQKTLLVVSEQSLQGLEEMVLGACETDYHFAHICVKRDLANIAFKDIRTAQAQDPCGKCGEAFDIVRGIEVGHVFYLGTKYSKAMNATFLNEKGQSEIIEMGCYGIGVGRTAAAAIEQNHDENGIIWPFHIAPFHVSLIEIGTDPETKAFAEQLEKQLEANNIEVLYDDRDERPGVKFKDHDLIGCPIQILVGGKSFKEGQMEFKSRKKGTSFKIPLHQPISDLVRFILDS